MRTFLILLVSSFLIFFAALAVVASDFIEPQFVVREETPLILSKNDGWQMLADFEKYPQWNPYLTKVEGEFSVGEQLQVSLVDGNFEGTVVVTPTLTEIVEGEQFCWEGTLGLPGLFDTRHCFVIHQDGKNSRVEQFEEFKGFIPIVFPVQADMAPHVRNSFQRMHEAMGARG